MMRVSFLHRVLPFILSLFVLIASQSALAKQGNLSASIEKAKKHLNSSGVGDDWAVIALSRAGESISHTYLDSKTEQLTQANGEFRYVTECEKNILGIGAAGGNPQSVAGYDLISKLLKSERVATQGLNGVVFALIAIDSKDYPIPNGSLWNREKLIAELLSHQNPDGGWSLFNKGKSDVDTTAMTLTALAPYRNQEKIKARAQRALTWLSSQQIGTGGFIAWGSEACESASQVIVALCSWGIDPTSTLFTKEGGNLLTNLYSFQQKNGSFAHTVKGEGNVMSTTQALQALVAYDYFLKSKGRFFHFSKMEKEPKPATLAEKHVITPEKHAKLEKKVVRLSPKRKVAVESLVASSMMGKIVRRMDIQNSLPSHQGEQKSVPKIEAIQPFSQSSSPTLSSGDNKRERRLDFLQVWLPIGIGCVFVLWGVALKWYRRRGL